MEKKFWKKGDKVVRIYGSNGWSRSNSMKPGDIGTLSEDQIYPGVVSLKEFPDACGHDPIRLRRLKDYKDFPPEALPLIWKLVDEHNFEGIVKILKSLLRRVNKKKGASKKLL